MLIVYLLPFLVYLPHRRQTCIFVVPVQWVWYILKRSENLPYSELQEKNILQYIGITFLWESS